MFKILLFCCVAASAPLAFGLPKTTYYPCDLDDLKCIGDNLAANSKCDKNVLGSISKKYAVPRFRFETPFFNASYLEKDLVIRNMDQCYVTQFFIDSAKDRTVLTVDCPNLDIESERTLVQHYTQKGDTEYTYHYRGEYPLVRFTTNLNHAESADFCTSFTFSDVTALPIYKINPKNKPTANFLSRDLTKLNIFERETFVYRGKWLLNDFLRKKVCNFDCKYVYPGN